MSRYGNRYDFVAPEAKRSGWQDASDTLEGVLESEKGRRAEIESNRRAHAQEGYEDRRVTEGERMGRATRRLKGFVEPGDEPEGPGPEEPDYFGPPGNPSSDPALGPILGDENYTPTTDDEVEGVHTGRPYVPPGGGGYGRPTGINPGAPVNGAPIRRPGGGGGGGLIDGLQYDPNQSEDAANDYRGAGIAHERDAFLSQLEQEKERRGRGYDAEDRARIGGEAAAAGAAPNEVPLLSEMDGKEVYDRRFPKEIDPRIVKAQRDMEKYKSDQNIREEAARARRTSGNRVSGRDYLPGLRARIDDKTRDISDEERAQKPRPYDAEPDSPAGRAFTQDSTARAGRIGDLRQERQGFESQHDRILNELLGGSPEAAGPSVRSGGGNPGEWGAGVRAGQESMGRMGGGGTTQTPLPTPKAAVYDTAKYNTDARYRAWVDSKR